MLDTEQSGGLFRSEQLHFEGIDRRCCHRIPAIEKLQPDQQQRQHNYCAANK